MKKFLLASSAVLIGSSAYAGNLDRSGQDISLLFDEGNKIEFSLRYVSPDITGTTSPDDSVAPDYMNYSLGYKADYNDKISYAVIYDQPYGANVDYVSGALAGLATADFESSALNVIGRYKFNENFSLHAGIVAQTVSATAQVPLVGLASLETDNSTAMGYLIGAAYERKDIALRADITYRSAIEHNDIGAVENGVAGTTSFKAPSSINFNFQTGVAANTLVFAGIRHADWSDTVLAGPTVSLVTYTDSVTTWRAGVGHRFSDNFSALIAFGYEKSTDEPASNLSPTDGYKSITVGGEYKLDNGVAIAGGISYVKNGDAITEALGAVYEDNSTLGLGLTISRSF